MSCLHPSVFHQQCYWAQVSIGLLSPHSSSPRCPHTGPPDQTSSWKHTSRNAGIAGQRELCAQDAPILIPSSNVPCASPPASKAELAHLVSQLQEFSASRLPPMRCAKVRSNQSTWSSMYSCLSQECQPKPWMEITQGDRSIYTQHTL